MTKLKISQAGQKTQSDDQTGFKITPRENKGKKFSDQNSGSTLTYRTAIVVRAQFSCAMRNYYQHFVCSHFRFHLQLKMFLESLTKVVYKQSDLLTASYKTGKCCHHIFPGLRN